MTVVVATLALKVLVLTTLGSHPQTSQILPTPVWQAQTARISLSQNMIFTDCGGSAEVCVDVFCLAPPFHQAAAQCHPMWPLQKRHNHGDLGLATTKSGGIIIQHCSGVSISTPSQHQRYCIISDAGWEYYAATRAGWQCLWQQPEAKPGPHACTPPGVDWDGYLLRNRTV